jgi:transposase
MKFLNVGIDVSADQLEVAYRGDDGKLGRVQFGNNAKDHRALIQYLRKRSRAVRVVMESTGIYGLDLALALEQAKGIEVMVANPRAVADFAKALLQRSKTDRADAVTILTFCERMPFVTWNRPVQAAFDLRAISRRIYALNDLIRAEKNRDHAAVHLQALPDVVDRSVDKVIRLLQREIEQLRDAAREVIKGNPVLQERYELLISVKGIGSVSAIRILGELALLPADMSPRQWVAHAGLDPRFFESGTSVHKRPRISKAGNKYLRAALYLPSVVAGQFDSNVVAFRRQLLDRGKHKRQVHVAIMRKLLHAIHGMFRHGQKWNGSKFFAAADAVGTSGIAPFAISEVSTAC